MLLKFKLSEYHLLSNWQFFFLYLGLYEINLNLLFHLNPSVFLSFFLVKKIYLSIM